MRIRVYSNHSPETPDDLWDVYEWRVNGSFLEIEMDDADGDTELRHYPLMSVRYACIYDDFGGGTEQMVSPKHIKSAYKTFDLNKNSAPSVKGFSPEIIGGFFRVMSEFWVKKADENQGEIEAAFIRSSMDLENLDKLLSDQSLQESEWAEVSKYMDWLIELSPSVAQQKDVHRKISNSIFAVVLSDAIKDSGDDIAKPVVVEDAEVFDMSVQFNGSNTLKIFDEVAAVISADNHFLAIMKCDRENETILFPMQSVAYWSKSADDGF